ncbi:MAG: hypothetical protein OEM97_00180 [Acidimicrobiia bacterium]|nr:hypothetical protein [Acidimicrobiia bacterium]
MTHIRTRTSYSVLISALVLVATACGSAQSSSVYEDPDERVLFEIPDGWNVYDNAELAQLQEVPFTAGSTELPVLANVAFDGAPGRSVENLNTSIASATFPIGAQVIRSVSSSQRDLLSRQLLEDTVFSFSTLESTQDILTEDFSFGGDYDGIRRFIGFVDDGTSEQGAIYFVSVTDPGDTTIYTMAAGCSVACFEQYQTQIVEVVDSWLVNTNQ